VGNGLNADVRAEASRKGDGRIYTITVVCTDVSGNSSTATTALFVPGKKGNDPKKTIATLAAANKKSASTSTTATTKAKKPAKKKK
jgi:hypothetical protein